VRESIRSAFARLIRTPRIAGPVVIVAIGLVGVLDYATGVELRVYPLYFLPLSVAAWALGRRGAVLSSLLAASTWWAANLAAGMAFSEPRILYVNIFAQSLGFLTVSLLIGRVRELLDHERLLARVDGLTGLSNSRAFHEASQLLASLSRRHDRPIAIAFIDLDNFKCVNDRLGHARGDEVLRRVGACLRDQLRSSDVAARLGGDEFGICMPETTGAQAEIVLERIRAALTRVLDVKPCVVSASIGAVAWGRAPARLDEMITAADGVMYEVKRGGKDRVQVTLVVPEPDRSAEDRRPTQSS